MLSPVLNPNSKRIVHILVLWAPLWIGTTVTFGLIGVVYGLFLKENLWLASQALLVREEANGASFRLGRFDSDTQMKAAQETILEVARHHQVVEEALKAVGPPPRWISWWGTSDWPSHATIEGTASSRISMRAPKGAEFGATEVIYLDVKQTSPDLARRFSLALSDALEVRLQSVRKTRAESIVAELTHARDSARVQLKTVTEQLQQLERTAGIELSDLRGMTDMIAGGGNSRIHLDQLKSEIRLTETKHQELLDDLKLIEDAIADPSSLMIAPTNVVTTQPGLKRLREGYAEAQLSASQLSGKFTEVHPLLVAARTTQDSIRGRLVNELEASLVSLNQEVKTNQHKLDRLRALKAETESKLGSLAENRAEYANVISEVKTRTTILENVERELAEAEATAEASSSTSLITRMDLPIVSEKPLGPGKTTIAGVCTLAGLMVGLGIVFVITPNGSGKSFGRRMTDMGRRREEDQLAPNHRLSSEHRDFGLAGDTILSEAVRTKSHFELPVPGSEPASVPLPESHSNVTERLERTLAVTDLRRERPAPIHFDESNLVAHRQPMTMAESNSTELESSAALVGTTQLLEEISNVASASDEHPKDPSFRDFLMTEINKTSDRRQQPRPAQAKPVAASLSMRPSPTKLPVSKLQ